VDDIYLSSLEAYASGNAAEARRSLETALKLNPQYDPARELLQAIDAAQTVQEQMDELQRLNF
jgi:cytochrome c-type biogenesis protein CcmH/NrfG